MIDFLVELLNFLKIRKKLFLAPLIFFLLVIGGLLIFYTRLELRDEIVEVLEITNNQMSDYTIGEEIIDVTG